MELRHAKHRKHDKIQPCKYKVSHAVKHECTVKFKSPSTLSSHHFNGILNQASPPLFSLPISTWESKERPL